LRRSAGECLGPRPRPLVVPLSACCAEGPGSVSQRSSRSLTTVLRFGMYWPVHPERRQGLGLGFQRRACRNKPIVVVRGLRHCREHPSGVATGRQCLHPGSPPHSPSPHCSLTGRKPSPASIVTREARFRPRCSTAGLKIPYANLGGLLVREGSVTGQSSVRDTPYEDKSVADKGGLCHLRNVTLQSRVWPCRPRVCL